MSDFCVQELESKLIAMLKADVAKQLSPEQVSDIDVRASGYAAAVRADERYAEYSEEQRARICRNFAIRDIVVEANNSYNKPPRGITPFIDDAVKAAFDRKTVDRILSLIGGCLPGSNYQTAREILLRECEK